MWALSRPTLFPDRFQLGGPLSVRSFQSNGLGPRDGRKCFTHYMDNTFDVQLRQPILWVVIFIGLQASA